MTDSAQRATAGASDDGGLASAQFRAFYAQLLSVQQLAKGSPNTDAAEAAKALSKRLLQVIELQTLEARRIGGKASGEIEGDARFLKAALADELMLGLDWAGRQAWRHELLETQVCNSSLAGDKVFNDIDRILLAREPAQRSRARLYLYVLSLGFQGRYRGSDALDKLASYRRELFQFIYQRPAEMLRGERVLSSQAYVSTLSHLTARRVPRLSRWTAVFLVTLLLLLGVSELLWLWQSWPLRKIISAPVAALTSATPA